MFTIEVVLMPLCVLFAVLNHVIIMLWFKAIQFLRLFYLSSVFISTLFPLAACLINFFCLSRIFLHFSFNLWSEREHIVVVKSWTLLNCSPHVKTSSVPLHYLSVYLLSSLPPCAVFAALPLTPLWFLSHPFFILSLHHPLLSLYSFFGWNMAAGLKGVVVWMGGIVSGFA